MNEDLFEMKPLFIFVRDYLFGTGLEYWLAALSPQVTDFTTGLSFGKFRSGRTLCGEWLFKKAYYIQMVMACFWHHPR